jgi:hypothetical protein
LCWRKEKGDRRQIIGEIKRTAVEGITFKYLEKGVVEAKKIGFNEYPGFPLDFDKIYSEDDLNVFGLRLQSIERPDHKGLLSFWEAEKVKDRFDLLALTQGLLPTDNFEFLGLYNPEPGLSFISDVAGISHNELSKNSVSPGDLISWQIEHNVHAFNNKAIKLFKGTLAIGYIKNIHNHPFICCDHMKFKPNVTVKSVDQNGMIKQIFIRVAFPIHRR